MVDIYIEFPWRAALLGLQSTNHLALLNFRNGSMLTCREWKDVEDEITRIFRLIPSFYYI